MDFIIVSGMSGAGKSKAASFLEDMGFFCVDNLPVPLIPKFAELVMAGTGEYDRVALVTDVRAGTNFDGLFHALDALEAMKCAYRILFMDAADETIIKRYKETRRMHPLQERAGSLEAAVNREITLMAPVRAQADAIIDSTQYSTARLRGELLRLFGGSRDAGKMQVSVVSFGFKHGLPLESDLVFDVRFLPNPFYIDSLRSKTGLEEKVRDYVFSFRETGQFMEKLRELLGFVLPLYQEEGKTVLVIAIGCTGGHHRSVAVTHALSEYIRSLGYQVTENHRDMTRT